MHATPFQRETAMTPFYTNQHTEQAKSNIFGNQIVANIGNSLTNNEKRTKNNFHNPYCQDALKCVSWETHMQKGSHEEPLNYHTLQGE